MRGRIYPPLVERFASRVDKTPGHGPAGDCWLWTGAIVNGGYGQIGRAKVDGGRVEYAHRIAYELHHGVSLGSARISGPLVLHRCDFRACVNPHHLFLGDDQANIDDMRAKGRQRSANQKGTANPAAKLTDDQVRAIRASRDTDQHIADAFGISAGWAHSIRLNEAWTHLLPTNNGVST